MFNVQIFQQTQKPTTSQAFVIALYSASAEDLDTTVCLFYFHDIKDAPRKTWKPETDLLIHLQRILDNFFLICKKALVMELPLYTAVLFQLLAYACLGVLLRIDSIYVTE